MTDASRGKSANAVFAARARMTIDTPWMR